MLLRARHKARPEASGSRSQRISDLRQRIAESDGLLPDTQPRYHIDYILLYLVLALTVLGVISVLSASAHVAQSQIGDASYFFRKQVFGVIVGMAALFGCLKLDIYRLPRYSRFMLVLTIALVMGTHLPFIGVTVNGSSNWLNLIVLRFQPSELAKPVLLIYLAAILGHPHFPRFQLKEHAITLAPVLTLMGMILLQPDLGMTVVLGLVLLLMYFTAGVPYWVIGSAMGVGLVGFLVKSFSTPYQQARITSWINPWADPQGQGFQLIQSMIAIGSGGLTGQGFGQSVQKLFYLPYQHTDFIFSVIAEEFGLLGVCLLLLLFVWLTQRGIRIACKCPTPYLKLLATGLTCAVSLQAFVNIGVVCGLLPTTGLTLPFISCGSTSLVVTLLCMGLLLNISQHVPPKGTSA